MSRDAAGRDAVAAAKRTETPKYRLIADELRAAILSEEYAPGARIPGENELMQAHQAARETARKALAVLQNEGLTETRRGVGVFVRRFKPIRRNAGERLSAQQWGAGRSIWEADIDDRPLRTDLLKVGPFDAPPRIARALNIDAGTSVWTRWRRYRVEDKPVMIATSYLPSDLVQGTRITEHDTGPGGIYARLREIGHGPAHFREELRARMPLPEETEALTLPSGTPIVTIARTAYAASGRAVEVNEMTLDASVYVLQYDFSA